MTERTHIPRRPCSSIYFTLNLKKVSHLIAFLYHCLPFISCLLPSYPLAVPSIFVVVVVVCVCVYFGQVPWLPINCCCLHALRPCPRCASGEFFFCSCFIFSSFLVKWLGCLSIAPCMPSGRVPSMCVWRVKFFDRSFFQSSSNCVYSLGLIHTVSSKNWLPPPLSPIASPLGHVANAPTHKNIFRQKQKTKRED